MAQLLACISDGVALFGFWRIFIISKDSNDFGPTLDVVLDRFREDEYVLYESEESFKLEAIENEIQLSL